MIMIHGIKEIENEDSNDIVSETLNEHLQEKYTDVDSDRNHWIGTPKEGKKLKPIVIMFVRYNTRNKVFKNKKVERH